MAASFHKLLPSSAGGGSPLRPSPLQPPPLSRQSSTPAQLSAFDRLVNGPKSSEDNPFINLTRELPFDVRLRMYTIGAVLFPFRVLLLVLSMSVCVVFALIGTAGLDHAQLNAPISGWRRTVLSAIYPTVRLILVALGFWPGHGIIVRGRRVGKAEAALVVSNHITFIEPICLLHLTGATPVSAKENANYPLIGTVIRALQCVLVDRKARGEHGNDQARESICSRASDPRFGQIMIFPEGTTSNGRAVITFKQGAFAPGLPVQPVAVRYVFQHFDPSWVAAGPSQYKLLIRTLLTPANQMEVTFLPVYTPSPAERKDPALYAANVQRVIANSLGVRVTQHSYDDVLLTIIARKANYPPEQAVPELNGLRTALNINASEAGKYLRAFMALDTSRTGRINFEQFKLLFQERIAGEDPVHAVADAVAAAQTGASTGDSAAGNASIATAIPASSTPASAAGACVAVSGGDAEDESNIVPLHDKRAASPPASGPATIPDATGSVASPPAIVVGGSSDGRSAAPATGVSSATFEAESAAASSEDVGTTAAKQPVPPSATAARAAAVSSSEAAAASPGAGRFLGLTAKEKFATGNVSCASTSNSSSGVVSVAGDHHMSAAHKDTTTVTDISVSSASTGFSTPRSVNTGAGAQVLPPPPPRISIASLRDRMRSLGSSMTAFSPRWGAGLEGWSSGLSTPAPQPAGIFKDGQKITDTDELLRLFQLLDNDEDGEINFRDFLLGLAMINGRGLSGKRDALRLAFKLMDERGAGAITQVEFARMFRKVWPDINAAKVRDIFRSAAAASKASSSSSNAGSSAGAAATPSTLATTTTAAVAGAYPLDSQLSMTSAHSTSAADDDNDLSIHSAKNSSTPAAVSGDANDSSSNPPLLRCDDFIAWAERTENIAFVPIFRTP